MTMVDQSMAHVIRPDFGETRLDALVEPFVPGYVGRRALRAGPEGLSARLRGITFANALTSPLQRARRTGELAGFSAHAEADADLMEWDYGAYEGRNAADIRAEHPGWRLFEDGCPGVGKPWTRWAPARIASLPGSVRVRGMCSYSRTTISFASSRPAGVAWPPERAAFSTWRRRP